MKIDEALLSLGVTDETLSNEQKNFLDENGYLPLEGLIPAHEVAAFASRLDDLVQQEGENAGKEVHQEQGTLRLSNLIDKDPIFERCLTQPVVLAAIRHVLGSQFKLSSLNSRAALPGSGHQALHVDWGESVNPGEYMVCNSIWLLDDFTLENGATRIVPGTHASGKIPIDVMDDAMADHPDQIQIVARAGSVVIFNSHLWHGGVLNRSDSLRRAMHVYFCRRDQVQQLDQRKFLRKKTIARLSPQARAILDVGDA
jgi:ectoine hydroxylase-related dioxygenase (phytanoyl-CoA dioxygenase family)